MLSTKEVLALVQGLASPLSPLSMYQPPFKFMIASRRAPAEPLLVDCRAIKLGLCLQHGWVPSFFEARVIELMDVLSWLAVCPGHTVAENPRLWQQIVQFIVGETNINGACLTFGNPATFPRWIIAFKAEFYEDYFIHDQERPMNHGRDRRFVEDLFSRAPTGAPSDEYTTAMTRIRPMVEQAERQPQRIPIGVDLDCASSNEGDGYFSTIRTFIQDLRASAFALSRVQFESLGLAMSTEPYLPEHIHDMDVLDAVQRDNGNVAISRFVVRIPFLDYSNSGLGGPSVQRIDQLRRDYGVMLNDLLRNEDRRGPLESIELENLWDHWNASVVCASLRTSTKAIDHFIVSCSIGFADPSFMSWIVYGLFHGTSTARVRLVELAIDEPQGQNCDLVTVLQSDRPGEILVGNRLGWQRKDEFEYCLVGTRARLRERNFELRTDFFNGTRSCVGVVFDDVPEFEVLATSVAWVGILVPAYGFGWVQCGVVDRIWREDAPAQQTHGVQDLIINNRSYHRLTVIPRFLAVVGSSLRSMALRSFTCPLEEETIDAIIRACPNAVAMQLPTVNLNPLVRAYEEGRCAVRSLVIENAPGEGPEHIQDFLGMLSDKNHTGSTILQELAFTYRSFHNTIVNPLKSETAHRIIMEMAVKSARLRLFYFVQLKHQQHTDCIWQCSKSEWQKTHPAISILTVGRYSECAVICRLDRNLWANVLEFMGPNRTIRVVPDLTLALSINGF